MCMCLVDVGTDLESVFSFCKRKSQFPSDFVCFFRRNFPRFERLPYMVCQHIVLACTAPGNPFILMFGEHKLFVHRTAFALIRAYQSAAVRFLRILNIVDYIRDNFSVRVFPGMNGFYPSRGDRSSPPNHSADSFRSISRA